MGMFNEYPYRNLTDLNLDYIFKIMKEVEKQVEYFVSLNAIKYADPIQWDITRQYEKNTIVIDPLTGTAYISVAPVPAGTALTRTEYWTVVFDLQRFVTKACKNFTSRYEAETTTTATFNTPKDGWLCWADVLYKANVNITAGDSYIPGGNITAFTMEDFGGHLDDLLTTDKTNVVVAINELFGIAQGIISDMGDLSDLTTTDQTSIVNAINELVTEISNAITIIGDLNDLTTTDKSSIVNAINELVTGLINTNNNIGDLNDLTTSDKSSIVNAINDITSIIPPGVDYITPEMYGAVGDGLNDDTQAIKDAITECLSSGKNIYFKSEKTYLISDTIDFGVLTYDVLMDGLILYNGSGVALQVSRGMGHWVDINVHSTSELNTTTGFKLLRSETSTFNIKDITGFEIGMDLTATGGGIAHNIFNLGTIANHHYGIKLSSSSGWCNENTFIGGRITCWSASSYNGSNIGIILDGDSYHNNNIFYHPSLETNYKCIVIEKGKYNCFYNCRFENSTYGVVTNNNSVHNHITYCGEPKPTYIFTANNGTSYWNEVVSTQTFTPYKIFDSGDIFNVVRTCADYDIAGDYLFGLSSNNKSKVYNIDRQNGYIRTAALWVEIAGLDNVNMLGVQINSDGNTSPMIKFFDSSDIEITNIPSPTGIGSYNSSGYDSNGYYQGDSRESGIIRWICIPETCTHVYIGTRVTGTTKLYSMQIFTINNTKYVTSEGYVPTMPYAVAHDLTRGLTQIPTGFGIDGEYVMNVGTDATIKGWYYKNGTWNIDYIYTPTP